MNTISVSNFALVTTTAAEEARKLRDELLGRAKGCALVTDAATQLAATNLLRDLRGFYKMIETGREEAKAPVLRIGREIDGLASELYGQIEAEGKRLSGILGSYDMEQKRLAEQKRQEAAREEARIRREAWEREQAEARRVDEENRRAAAAAAKERARIQQEADAKAARARTEAGRERAAKEAEARKAQLAEQERLAEIERQRKADEAAEARAKEEARQVAQTRSNAGAVMAAKPKDTATREDIKFEVTDIQALYEAAPFLVRLEPNTAAIKAALKGLTGIQTLPGVKHWKEAMTVTRG